MRANEQRAGPGKQRQGQSYLSSFTEPPERPHQADDQSRQADPLQDGQPRIEGQSQVDGLCGGPVIDIVAIDKHQKKFQDDRRSNPDQSPVQIPILLAPPRLSLVIIHVP